MSEPQDDTDVLIQLIKDSKALAMVLTKHIIEFLKPNPQEPHKVITALLMAAGSLAVAQGVAPRMFSALATYSHYMASESRARHLGEATVAN